MGTVGGLAANDGGLLNDAMRQRLWSDPKILGDVIRSVRAFVNDPTASVRKRVEAKRGLKKYGFDDESLAKGENSDPK